MSDNYPEWAYEYLRGATLEEVGDSEDVTRETVRLWLKKLGIPVRSKAETRRMQQQRFAEMYGTDAKNLFLEHRGIDEVAKRLEAPAATVRTFIKENVPDHAVLIRAPRNSTKRYSDAELLDSLRLAADGLDTPLTGDVYEQRIGSLWPADDPRRPPSKQAFPLKFESWRGALHAAGLPANPTTQVPKKFGDPALAIAAIVDLWRELGKPPTVRDYDAWDSAARGYPSSALVRRLVDSWNTGLVKAWQIVHGIRLDQDDADMTVPPSLLETVQYPPYVKADEIVTVVGQQKSLDEYTQLERALRSHAHLQNRLAEELSLLGHAPVSPSSAPPSFDLAFHLPRSTVVVEVKSATPSNLELQLRIGVGQVLWYAHEMRLRHESVHAALAVELEPPDRWNSLLHELGIYLVTLPNLKADVAGLVQWAELRDVALSGPS